LPRVFISYRREETAYPASWLFDRLEERFGEDNVFKDVDSIVPGEDFVDRITKAVAACDVLLALIGDDWLTIEDETGGRRLDSPDDFVRVEIEAGLARDVRVIPVLVDGAAMPDAAQLPPSLAPLARRQALELSANRFDFDSSRLLAVLDATGDGAKPTQVVASGRHGSRRTWILAGVAAAAVVLVTAAVVALASRSDDGSSNASAGAGAGGTTSATWAAQANAVCERANETIDDLPDPSAESLETLGPGALTAYGESAVKVNKRMVRDLGELSPPPEARSDANELVVLGAKMTEAAEEMFAALRVGDVAAAQKQQQALSRAGKEFDAKALEVGATTCAEGASLSGTALPTG